MNGLAEAFVVANTAVLADLYFEGVAVEAIQATKTYKILRWFCISLFCENGMLSKGAVIATISFSIFIGGSLYLLINNINWLQYPTFASVTGGGGVVAQIVNKGMALYTKATKSEEA